MISPSVTCFGAEMFTGNGHGTFGNTGVGRATGVTRTLHVCPNHCHDFGGS